MKPKNIPESWYQGLKHLFDDNRLEALRKGISSSADTTCPEIEKVFRAFQFFDFGNTKVVFVCLSPYQRRMPYEGQLKNYATGVAMGVPDPEFLTPTLTILLGALEDYLQTPEIEHYLDFTLETWAKQGILLLNRALTVPLDGNPREHLDAWTWFTKGTIEALSKTDDKKLFVFMGKDAQGIDVVDRSKHEVLYTCHPVATAYAYDRLPIPSSEVPEHLDFSKFQMFKVVDDFMQRTHNKTIQWIS